jgi:hypothetical protein
VTGKPLLRVALIGGHILAAWACLGTPSWGKAQPKTWKYDVDVMFAAPNCALWQEKRYHYAPDGGRIWLQASVSMEP